MVQEAVEEVGVMVGGADIELLLFALDLLDAASSMQGKEITPARYSSGTQV